jgi:2-hydroxy-3-keto-5-methylthiopentenyl-1-phosphate phosphatase
MPLITVEPAELDELIDSVEVDPFFAEFALHCGREKHALYILSDGFDYWVQRILRRALSVYNGAAPELPVFACGLKVEEGKVAISFPYFPEGCAHGCATCKPALFAQLKRGATRSVVIGDGVSDLLLAREADLVLAKNGLREFCEREGIASRAMRDFRDALRIIKGLKETDD